MFRARGSQPSLPAPKISKGVCARLLADPIDHIVERIAWPFVDLLAVSLVVLQGPEGRERKEGRERGREGGREGCGYHEYEFP